MATITLNADVANNPVMNSTGGQSVSLDTLISGEDQTNNWLQTANGANQYYTFKPQNVADTTTFGTVNGSNGLLIGITGAAGDYLDKVIVNVETSAQARLALQDVSAVSYTSSGTGTAFTSVTSINFGTGSTSLTSTKAAALVGQYLICTATVSGSTCLVARKITAATATSGTAPNLLTTLTVDTITVGGVGATAISTTAGQAFISPLINLVAAGQGVGTFTIPVGAKSKYGGWRLFVDSGVAATVVGKFS